MQGIVNRILEDALEISDVEQSQSEEELQVSVFSKGHVPVTLVGQDYLTLSNQEITAGLIQDDHIDWGTGANQVSAADMPMVNISSSTFTTVQHLQDIFHSTGWVSGGAVTDAGSGIIDVTAGTGLIRATDSRTAELLFIDWSASNGLATTINSINYVGIQYNAGSPNVFVTTNYADFDFNTKFPISAVTNESDTLHILNDQHAVGDHANFMVQRVYATNPIARDERTGGLTLGETETRNITLSTGILWERLNPHTISAIDTFSSGGFDTYTGTTKDATGATQWDNDNYDNGGTKTALSANKYGVLWFYSELDDELVMVYGTSQHNTAAGAETQTAPSTIPNRLVAHAKLIGRLIFKKGEATARSIESVFTTSFSPTLATDHGNLAGLSDDDHTQYSLVDGTRAYTGAVTVNNLTINSGSIIDSSGAISFGNENLSTTGTLSVDNAVTFNTSEAAVNFTVAGDSNPGLFKVDGTANTVNVNTLIFAGGSITDSTGAISFGNENLSTTGTLSAGAITGTSVTTGLTTGRVIYTTTAGLLTSSGNLTYSGSTFSNIYTNSTGASANGMIITENLTAGNSNFPSAIGGTINFNSGAGTHVYGVAMTGIVATSTGQSGTVSNAYGLDFACRHYSTSGATISNWRGINLAMLGTANSDGNVTTAMLLNLAMNMNAGHTGNIGSFYGIRTSITTTGAGTTTNFWGIELGTPVTAGHITNVRQLLILAPTTFSANNQVRIGLQIAAIPDPGAFTGTTAIAINLQGTSGNARDGILFGTDTNLFRSAASTLKTDDSLLVGTKLGVNVSSITGQAHIDQSSTSAAIPVIHLDQADVSEEFLRLTGAAAAGVITQSFVEVGEVAGLSVVGYFKINVQDVGNQIVDGDYYVAFGTLIE